MSDETIEIICECGRKMEVDVEHSGKSAKCPDCGEPVPIPIMIPVDATPPERERTRCPYCKEEIFVGSSTCKHCDSELEAPSRADPPAEYSSEKPASADTGGMDILVFAIIGFVTGCLILGVVSWIRGNTYIQDCRARGVTPSVAAVAGRIMGKVQTILCGVVMVIAILFSLFGTFR